MSVKFCFEIPSDCWENCKTLRGLLFCRTLYRKLPGSLTTNIVLQFNSSSTDSFGELDRPLIPASIRVRTLASCNASHSETLFCQCVVLRESSLKLRCFFLKLVKKKEQCNETDIMYLRQFSDRLLHHFLFKPSCDLNRSQKWNVQICRNNYSFTTFIDSQQYRERNTLQCIT